MLYYHILKAFVAFSIIFVGASFDLVVITAEQTAGSRLCPEQATCNDDEHNNSFRSFKEFNCQCDEKCNLYNDCCEDSIYFTAFNDGEKLNARTATNFECLAIKTKAIDNYDITIASIYMVNSCPRDPTNLPSEGCSIENDGYDDVVDLNTQRDVMRHIPVTNFLTGVTYSNFRCALCNGESLINGVHDSLKFWNVGASIEKGDDFQEFVQTHISGNDSQDKFIKENMKFSSDGFWIVEYTNDHAIVSSKLNLYAIHPQSDAARLENTNVVRECVDSNLVDSCGSTYVTKDDWDEKCVTSAMDVVYDVSNNVYRNQYCAYCRNVTGTDANADNLSCWPISIESRFNDFDTRLSSFSASPSFSILFDISSTFIASQLCPSHLSQIFDPFLLKCRDIVCTTMNCTDENESENTEDTSLSNLTSHLACASSVELQKDEFNIVEEASPDEALKIQMVVDGSILIVPLYKFEFIENNERLKRLFICSEIFRNFVKYDIMDDIMTFATFFGLVISMVSLVVHITLVFIQTKSGEKRAKNFSSNCVTSLSVALLGSYVTFFINLIFHDGSSSYINDQTFERSINLSEVDVENYSSVSSSETTRWFDNNTRNGLQPHEDESLLASHEQCIHFAIPMYYFFTSIFTWSAIISFDVHQTLRASTQSLRRAKQGAQWRKFILYSSIAWSIPFIASMLLAVTEIHSSDTTLETIKPEFDSARLCWFSNRYSLLIFFVIPTALVMFTSFALFVHSIWMIFGATLTNSKSTKSAIPNLATYFKLAVMMGISWLLGFVALITNVKLIWLLFILVTTLQGLFILLAFSMSQNIAKKMIGKCCFQQDPSSSGDGEQSSRKRTIVISLTQSSSATDFRKYFKSQKKRGVYTFETPKSSTSSTNNHVTASSDNENNRMI